MKDIPSHTAAFCRPIFFALLACVLSIPFSLRASVVGWGALTSTNNFGQLVFPSNLTGAKAVAAGGWHGLAVTVSSNVAAWGLNDYGQTNVPAGLSNVIAVAGGFDHSLALKANGTVIGWGITSNLYAFDPDWFGQADVPADVTNAIAITAGAFHSMALRADGTVEAWGYDFYGQCDVPANLSNVAAIAGGGYFSLALKNDGTVVAWGDNYYGQTNVPANLTNVVAIAAGGIHALALKADGTVQGWGARGVADFTQDFGQENAPADLTNAVGIAAGFFHSLALQSNGTVRQWGDTSEGQTNPPNNLSRVLSLAAGYAHSFALLNDTPSFLSQPTNVASITNKAVSFVAKVSGSTPMRATWRRNGATSNLVTVVFTNSTVSTSFSGGSAQANNATNLSATTQFTLNLLASYVTVSNAGDFYVIVTNSLGSITSSVATLSVLLPPKITSQPASVASMVGGGAYFSVGASGGQPLGYRWYFISGGVTNPIVDNPDGAATGGSGATNFLSLWNLTITNAGSYQVVVTNAIGSVTSSVATLTVDGSPSIFSQPTNASVVIGSNATFNAVVSGAQPLTYQWYFYQTNTLITALSDGITNASYTVTGAQPTNAGNYFLVVNNGFSSVTSSVAILTVLTPPTFITSPTNLVTLTNKAVSFVAKVSGSTPMRAAWRRNGATSNLVTVVFTNTTVTTSFSGGSVQAAVVTNQTGTQFTLNLLASYVTVSNAGDYYVIITNSLGSITSSVATLSVLLPPKITNQPAGIATNPDVSVSFTVGASGSQPFSYQWYFISGGLTNLLTSQTNVLQLDNISSNDAGSYQVIVANPVGSVTSSMAILTVGGGPVIVQPPTNASVGLGSNATFSVVANGIDPLAYQWYFYQTNNGVSALADATNTSYSINSAQTTDGGNYFVVVNNDFGSATSSVAILTVMTPPVFLAQPTNIVTITNKAVSFVAKVSGATPLRATWWRSGVTNGILGSVSFTNGTISTSFSGGNVQGAIATNQSGTQFTLNLLASYVTTTNAANYFVVVSNSMGVITSSVASLSVLFPPKLTSQPVNVATNPSSTVFFAASATGSQSLNYQWYFISGGVTNLLNTSQTNVLELDNVSTNDAGSYQLVITNPVGSVTSTAARLSILVNGASSAPYIWLLNHDSSGGDGIMIALESGRNYRVQASADLVSWTDVTNFLSHSSLAIFTNADFTNLPSQFYRVVTP